MNAPTIEQVKQFAATLVKKTDIGKIDEKALHCYRAPDGLALYWRVRIKNTTTGAKWIRPFWWIDEAFVIGEPPAPPEGKALYALELLTQYQSAVVIVTEGENKVDAINKAAMQGDKTDAVVATTSGGSSSAQAANWAHLAGRYVVIFRDNDDAGEKYQTEVIECLNGIAESVRVINVAALKLPHKGDAVDFFKAGGTIDTLMLAIDAAKPVEQKTETLRLSISDSINGGKVMVLPQGFAPLPVVQITCAADIKPVSVSWLWEGWLARGKMHIFAGQAGTGKTTIALALAATISNGGRFPDGTRSPVGDVMIWSGEDSPEDTLVPRLIAAGADMRRVHFVGDVRHGDDIRSFDPASDIQALTDAATRICDVSMLIVDPVVSAVQGDSHKNGEVRRALQPLVDFGERLGCAVLGISHFSKGTGGKDPLERVSGSLAFGALARIVLATAKTTEGESTRRIFCRAKSNIGQDSGGYEYDLKQIELTDCKGLFASYAVWGEAVEGTARELLTVEQDETEGGDSLSDAKDFLLVLLADAPLPTKTIRADCEGAGYSWATIRRAQKSLGIEAAKEGFGKGAVWVWKLSKTRRCSENIEDAQQNSVSTFVEIEHLREESAATGVPNASHLRI